MKLLHHEGRDELIPVGREKQNWAVDTGDLLVTLPALRAHEGHRGQVLEDVRDELSL